MDENKQKEAGIGPFFKKILSNMNSFEAKSFRIKVVSLQVCKLLTTMVHNTCSKSLMDWLRSAPTSASINFLKNTDAKGLI